MQPDSLSPHVAAHLQAVRLPWLLGRGGVQRVWRSVETEARTTGEHPLRVVQRRHGVIDARASGLLGFDGFLIAVLAAVFALDLLQTSMTATLAGASAIGLLLGSGNALSVLRMPLEPDTNDAGEYLARTVVDLARRAQQYRRTLLLTELAGVLAAMLAGGLISPHFRF
jgi:hypothetical protein